MTLLQPHLGEELRNSCFWDSLSNAQLVKEGEDFLLKKDTSKDSSHLYPVSSVKEHNRKGGKCKISWVLRSPVPSTQASPKVEASQT